MATATARGGGSSTARRKRKIEPIEYRAARVGERAGRESADATRRAAGRTRETLGPHPSTTERRRRFGGAATGPAAPDEAPAHARMPFGETPPISETPLAGQQRGRGRRGGRGGRGGAADTTPDQRPAFLRDAPQVPKVFRSTSRVLIAEFLICLVLIALKPSEPAPGPAGEPAPGAAGAMESTIPQLIAIMVVFMLLAALGAAGPNQQRVANLFGGAITVTLLFKNHAQVVSSVTVVTGSKVTPYNAAPAAETAADATPTPAGQ